MQLAVLGAGVRAAPQPASASAAAASAAAVAAPAGLNTLIAGASQTQSFSAVARQGVDGRRATAGYPATSASATSSGWPAT